jgi:penicillin-binding protein-related factor A (putative recombinase)
MKPGGKLESLIQKTGDRLSRRQIARLWKWPVPTIELATHVKCQTCDRPNFSKILVRTARTGCDFFGYARTGQFLAIEAKENSRRRLPVNVETGDGLHVHQAQMLREVQRAGGKAFVVWFREGKCAVIPIIAISIGLRSVEWTPYWERPVDKEQGILGLLHPYFPDPDYAGASGLGD